MQCVGLERSFQRNDQYAPGMGVVTSAGVYRRLTGKIRLFAGTPSKLGLNGSMPLPLVVVVSGKTTIIRLGCFATRVSKSVRFAPCGGSS
jgi:hypothetical protein